MSLAYESVLVLGPYLKLRSVLARHRKRAVVIEVGVDRWVVVPEPVWHRMEITDNLARLFGEATESWTAAFQVSSEPDQYTVVIQHSGRRFHLYHSEQGHTFTNRNEDDEPIVIDVRGRRYRPGDPRPTGPYGADPEMFLPLAAGPVDRAGLAAVLTGTAEPATRHLGVLHHLGIDPGPLRMTFEEAVQSRLGRVTPGPRPS
ncbi:hypothetical protein [Actinoplanes derwentensis]|uniref:Uncharacterized protein n=1 Tax=Actinoplanes derwentensis TaxID=113562 RepID=A0A1H2A1E8_9ACTN|nr:hypothetical protein [Actinoplanes derwentensis]GID83424.1 hypothetical protein Ade03nite_23480 [Actinoplanes derwentensis]SDT39841.1 hypothetical protein SAMN04489716_3616 [Actinoplanes derwentensis]